MFCVLSIFAAAIFALDDSNENIGHVYIEVDNEGNVNVSLPDNYFQVERYNDIITLRL